ncbi:ferredoxin [Zhihengliuella halotolerans]|uniref:ferredoxin n=1 Tax=Zhihengliuella halotolerans TaxID=370736 RepID=UPI000C80BE76|nr:ferredoxin [Zhihengliuella halotolerans]
MKVTVHQPLCVASGNCGHVAPRVFRNRDANGGFVELLAADPPEGDQDAVREAEYLCPSGTIQVDDHPMPPRPSTP